MQGNVFPMVFQYEGTLAANKTASFVLPMAATLVEVSAVAENNSDATLTFGTAADPDGYRTAQTIGDSGVPKVFGNGGTGKTAFSGALYTGISGVDYIHHPAGTVFTFDLDFDGSAGTAAQDVTLVFWFELG